MRRFSLPGEGGIDAFYEPIGATQSFDTSAAPRMPRSDTSSSQTWFSESRTDGATLKCHGSATNLLKRPTTEGLFCHLEALEFCWRVELGVWRGYRDQLRDSDQIVGEQVKHELGDHAGDAATSGAWCGAAWPQPRPSSALAGIPRHSSYAYAAQESLRNANRARCVKMPASQRFNPS